MELQIRQPVPGDAAALGRLHAEAWNVAYADQMPAELLAHFTVARRTAMWERVIASAQGERERIAIADVDGTAVGFARTGPCRDEDGPQGAGELYAINVSPHSWRGGVGTALLEAAHESLAANGFSLAVLWVLPGNDRARRFYVRHDWFSDGTAREDESHGFLVPEVRYSRRF
ncbi:GNAT family N-acetyltransferase [Actinospica durhamensis]|uniref:GNAT family N-acetyltransferase n=1 Tax=Actinospica durhamensis TaxID=1508375 RepID=A0A941EJ23_9ACTN|nr:GNAT family N-acetyltransferase [Actinospica durhamensis]MBR7831728.1 GNAT family N-acetyltransferase [Actinospica durhamensis]